MDTFPIQTDKLINLPAGVFAALSFLVGILFIISLVKLTEKKAASCLKYGLAGVFLAIILVLPSSFNHSHILMALGITLIGIISGISIGTHTKMTSIPQIIAMLQTLIGFIIAGFCFIKIFTPPEVSISLLPILTTILGIYIFSTGFISTLKLNDLIHTRVASSSSPFRLGALTILLLLITFIFLAPDHQVAISIPIFSLTLILSIYSAYHVTRGDIPVIASTTNVIIGLALFFIGMTHSILLLSCVGGVIFGCGSCLTLVMTKAMNRPLSSVLFP